MYKASNPFSLDGPHVALVVYGCCCCYTPPIDVLMVESRVVESVLRIVY